MGLPPRPVPPPPGLARSSAERKAGRLTVLESIENIGDEIPCLEIDGNLADWHRGIIVIWDRLGFLPIVAHGVRFYELKRAIPPGLDDAARQQVNRLLGSTYSAAAKELTTAEVQHRDSEATMLIIHSLSDDVLAALLVPFEGIETRQSPETSHEWWTHIVEHFPRIQALQQRQVTFRELANRMFVEREKNREVFFSMKADKQCTYLNAFLDSWFRALALALVPGDPCLARESDLTAALVLALEASPYGRAASDEFARRPHQPLAELIASIARDAQSHADGALAERNLSYEPTEVERNAMRHYDTGRRSAWFFWNLSQFHITHDRKDFVTYTQYSPRRQLTTGHKVLGFGTVLLWPVIPGVKDAVPPLVFTNVLHVPAYEHKVMGNVDEVGSVHLCQAGVKVMVATPQSESSDDDDAEDDDHDSNTADDRPRRRRGIDGDMDDAALFHAGRLRCSGRMFRQLFCLNVRGTVWDKPDTQPRLMRFTPPVEFERE